MTNAPQQPQAMDNGLLHMHGLWRQESFDSVTKEIKSLIAGSVWPRILIAKCRLLTSTILPLVADGYPELIDILLKEVGVSL